MIAYSLPPSIEPMIAPTLASCNHWRVCTDTLHLGLIVSCRVSKLSQISFSACHVFCLSHRKACKQKENQFMRKGSDIKVAHVVHCSTEHPDTIGSQACFRWHLCLSALLGEAESVSCLATAVAPWAQWKNAYAM